jgi:hypothetical protein
MMVLRSVGGRESAPGAPSASSFVALPYPDWMGGVFPDRNRPVLVDFA